MQDDVPWPVVLAGIGTGKELGGGGILWGIKCMLCVCINHCTPCAGHIPLH